MLGRIADLGADLSRTPARDALTSDDFRIVRMLPGWATFETRLTGAPAPSAPAPSAPSAPLAPASSAPSAPSAPHELNFDAPDIDAVGLAHDIVSRRFVLGDRKARRLLVIDEISRHVVNYVSASSAGFYDDLTAFTIDSRRGDLWVVSAKGEADTSASVLHKLQLVSGRTLLEAAPDAAVPVRFVDVTVTPDGTVYALDSIESRIYRLRPGSRTLESMMRIDAKRPTALTAADDRTLYVAAEKGLVRVDVAAREATFVKSAER
jgi:hypothetical protein